MAPLAKAGDPAAFDCGKEQNRLGRGDFAVDLRFAPVLSRTADPLVLRTSSVWQDAERVIFQYADGTRSELSFNSRNSRP